MQNGFKPSGILMIDKVLSPEQRAKIRVNFKDLAEGGEDALRILEAGMKYEQVSMNPIEIIVLDIPDSLNTILRMSWPARKKMQDYWNMLIWSCWNSNDRIVFLRPVQITYTITFSSSRDRDYDNYFGGTKFITDALKRTFFQKDDSRWLKGINVVFCTGATKQTQILIEEVDLGPGGNANNWGGKIPRKAQGQTPR